MIPSPSIDRVGSSVCRNATKTFKSVAALHATPLTLWVSNDELYWHWYHFKITGIDSGIVIYNNNKQYPALLNTML